MLALPPYVGWTPDRPLTRHMRLFVGGTIQPTIDHVGLEAYKANFGQLLSWRDGSNPRPAVELGVPWAVDNYAFSGFEPEAFIKSLQKWRGIPGCLWCVAPDVPGNAELTLRKFYGWAEVIRAYGFPVALAAQNGLENMTIPWDEFDCLFVGGTTEWKLGATAAAIVREAQKRGKLTHNGRVNSGIRLRYSQMIGFDSVDGSGYAIIRYKSLEALGYLETRQPLLLLDAA